MNVILVLGLPEMKCNITVKVRKNHPRLIGLCSPEINQPDPSAEKSEIVDWKLQNRAARMVTNSPYDASALPLIGSLGWLTSRELIDFETSKMVYKSLNALAPDYLRNVFQKVSEATNRQLRNSKTDLRLPLLKTSTGQKSFAYRGARVWTGVTQIMLSKRPHHSAPFEEIVKPKYDSPRFPFLF